MWCRRGVISSCRNAQISFWSPERYRRRIMGSLLMRKLTLSSKFEGRIFKSRQHTKRLPSRNFSTEPEQEENEDSAVISELQNVKEVKITFPKRGDLVIGHGRLAKLADGCATASYKNTTVMATVVSTEKPEGSASFVPLSVNFKQKAAALGRIPLNFLRRELGQTEYEVLTSRMVDRSVRPFFPEGFFWDTQIICNPLAIDGNNFPDVLAINAASAALELSDVPWNGPVGAVRVGLIEGEAVTNPSKREMANSELNLVMTTSDSKNVTMLEGSALNVTLSDFLKCLKHGSKECQRIINGIKSLRKVAGKEKRTFECAPVNESLRSSVEAHSASALKEIFQNFNYDKLSRDRAVNHLRERVMEKLRSEFSAEEMFQAPQLFSKVCKKVFRDLILETEIRCDGRTPKELREIVCAVDLYKPLHGSALFQRGQTQVLCTVALDSPNSALRADKVSMLTSGIKEKNFFVHYDFPPFATNETGRLGPIGRREMGHGALAEKALKPNIPDQYPFTIRLTSEVLESNGSSSMATVCGGTLALMDAGVPIANLCAGVAMGFISKYDENDKLINYQILTDLLGIEDYFGDIDFKIAGTKKAFTAVQLDVKNNGIPMKIMSEIMGQAKDAIGEILQKMRKVCPQVRTVKKDNWPEMTKITVPPQTRSKFLGPGGINVKKLEAMTGVEITEDTFGEFEIFAANKDALKEANEIITEILKSGEEKMLDFGAVYTALITEVKDQGCMVRLYPNMKPVLIHLSQLDIRKVNHPSALGLEVGQQIMVKYFGRDPVSGAMRLSRKVLLGPASEVVQTFIKKEEDPESDDTRNGGVDSEGKK